MGYEGWFVDWGEVDEVDGGDIGVGDVEVGVVIVVVVWGGEEFVFEFGEFGFELIEMVWGGFVFLGVSYLDRGENYLCKLLCLWVVIYGDVRWDRYILSLIFLICLCVFWLVCYVFCVLEGEVGVFFLLWLIWLWCCFFGVEGWFFCVDVWICFLMMGVCSFVCYFVVFY